MKVCMDCGEKLQAVRFARMETAPAGRESRCLGCRDIPNAQKGDLIERECRLCGAIMPLRMFGKVAGGRLGYASRCKECERRRGREYTGKSVASMVQSADFEQLMKSRAEGQNQRNAWMADKRARGLCTSCGKRAVALDRVRCKACLESRRLRYGVQKKERVRYRRESGLCENCGTAIPSERQEFSWRCAECASKKTVLARQKRKRRPLQLRAAKARSRIRVKDRVLDMYGKVCACCGFDDERFLCVDHMNNDGKQDRAGKRNSLQKLLKLKRDDIQILCYNCNFAKEVFGGTCPHKILIRGKGWNVVKTA